jgi:glycerol-3-phosphate dehydrogenase
VCRVACVEKNDFGSGTSSRSTKLIHGGVRYLEKAVFQADLSQLKLVFEALHERKAMMHNAPHLSQALPIMTPCYSWWELPYYWAGLKLYDLVAGPRGLTWSYVMPADRAHRLFPTLALNRRDDHRSLKGTIVYYDGQFNDARMNALLAVSAAAAGATMANHVAVVDVLKDDQDKNKITGVKVQDLLTGQNLGPVYAKCVVNATGAYSDAVRGMSQPGVAPMVQPSAGVHITLPDYYSPQNVGMIVPKTKDGRVVFMLPWLDHTIAGTTDGACGVEDRPQPKEEDINFILDALKDFLTVQVRRSDVMSAWSGIRPLAADPTAGDTENVSRDHVVCVENDGLVTIAGGKV